MEIPIPGYSSSSGIDTQKIIQDLIEVKRKPIYTLEGRIEDSQYQVRLWNNLERNMRQFQNYGKQLYGFENPFDERDAVSSDEAVLTVDASRSAQIGEFEVLVKQTAAADIWASDSVRKDMLIPEGVYTFTVGEKITTFDFSGGDVQKFVDEFTAEADSQLITMKAVQRSIDKNYITLIIESKKRGKKFALSLSDSAEKFSYEVGFQKYGAESASQKIAFTNDTITRVISDASFVEKKGSTFSALMPGGIAHFTLSHVLLQKNAASKDAELTLQFALQPFSQDKGSQDTVNQNKEADPNPRVTIRDRLEATLEDVTVSGVIEMQNNRDTTEVATQKLGVVFSADGMHTLHAIDSQERKNTLSVNLPLVETRDANGDMSFIVANPFPHYKLVLQNASVQTAGEKSAVVVKNPISRARNAVVQLNGVDIERETNVIDDMLPGIALTAKRASDDVILVSVRNDEKLIKDTIINFVGSYNQMMKQIILYTIDEIKGRDSVLDLLQFEDDTALEQAKEDLGRLSGNFSLVRLTNSLVTAFSRRYPSANKNSQITMLSNIGIASNISDRSASFTRLSGRFLDIDETMLDEALAKNMDDVAELFGSDQNNDIAIEEGVAFATVELIRPFIITGGITSQKRKVLQRGVEDNRKQISRYEKQVVDYHKKIKKDFATMEQSLSKLENASSTLEGLSGSGSR